MKLPNVLYAIVVEPTSRDGSPYIQADVTAVAVMNDDGPTVIGEYKLVRSSKVVKQPVEVKPTRRARRK